jgi:hypothetical protein
MLDENVYRRHGPFGAGPLIGRAVSYTNQYFLHLRREERGERREERGERREERGERIEKRGVQPNFFDEVSCGPRNKPMRLLCLHIISHF